MSPEAILEKVEHMCRSVVAEYNNTPEDTGDEFRTAIETGWMECADAILVTIRVMKTEVKPDEERKRLL